MTQDLTAPRLTAAELAEATGGRLVGDPSVTVTAFAPPETVGAPELSSGYRLLPPQPLYAWCVVVAETNRIGAAGWRSRTTNVQYCGAPPTGATTAR